MYELRSPHDVTIVLKSSPDHGQNFGLSDCSPCIFSVPGVCTLLSSCEEVLRRSQNELLQIIFSLAQDEWPSVSEPCWKFLGEISSLPKTLPHKRSSDWEATNGHNGISEKATERISVIDKNVIMEIFTELLDKLEISLEKGEQHGALHAKKLTTALQVKISRNFQLLR